MTTYIVETTAQIKTRRNSLVLTTKQFIDTSCFEYGDNAEAFALDDIRGALHKLDTYYQFGDIDDQVAKIEILSQKTTAL